MPALCNRQWTEVYQPGRAGRAILHHQCIRALGHDPENGPCRCACDPVYELRVDFEAFVRGGAWARDRW